MSFGFADLINNNLSLPCYTTFCSFLPHSSLALSFCNCQSYGSFFWQDNRDTHTHICSRCNLACVLSDEYLEEKLIIIVGGVDQREKCRGASVLNPNFEHTASLFHLLPLLFLLFPLLPSAHCSFAAKSCPCRPRPFWKGLAYSMWGVFFFGECWQYMESKSIGAPGFTL